MIEEIFKALGAVQNNGGLLVLLTVLIMRLEHVKELFHRHESVFHGVERRGDTTQKKGR